MKSTIKFLFATLLASSFLFTACNKETEVAPKVTEITEDNFLEVMRQSVDQSQELTVEYATLEEINAEMVANGLEPFTQEDAERAAQLRTTYPCSDWITSGDWNNSNTLSTFDLVLATQYLCNSSAGCSGTVSTNGLSGAPLNFGFLSFLKDGTELFALNANDTEAGRDFILGRIICF
ncbi:MAG: hypothetical protein AAFV95_20045 [Bacteroidota bacterium]